MPQKPTKITTSERVLGRSLKFPLAVLKGIIEKNDGAAYFGSLIGYPVWVEETKALGLIRKMETGWRATQLGEMIYDQGIDLLPRRGRAVGWDWPVELIEKADRTIALATQSVPLPKAEKEERS
jgi:hypothetical protein